MVIIERNNHFVNSLVNKIHLYKHVHILLLKNKKYSFEPLCRFDFLITIITKDKGGLELVNIGNNIRYFRKKTHLTQEQLAEKSGLSVNFISRLERTSDQNVSIKTLIKIAEVFNISLAELVSVPDLTSEKLKKSPKVAELVYHLEKLDNTKAEKFSCAFLQILEASNDN